jgi:LmbE family N-acetylglucosaminyl deacetylase
MTDTVAAIFAHPDDEVLGCGAALAKHADAGASVRILILATGLAAGAGKRDRSPTRSGPCRCGGAGRGAAGICRFPGQ